MNKPSPPGSVVVVAPHPDDEVLGCGGALCRHAADGARIAVIFLTSGELGLKHLPRERAWRIREREARAAARILGVARVEFLRGPDWGVDQARRRLLAPLRRLLQEEKPVLIYLPHPADGHPDHQAAEPLVRKALSPGRGRPPVLRGYEVWTPLGAFDHVEDITEVMPRKLRALRAHASQLKEFDYERAIRGLNQYRGVVAAKRPFVEVFQTLART